MKELLRLLPYIKRYYGLLIAGIIGAVFTKVFQLSIPYFLGQAVDEMKAGPGMILEFIWYCVLALVILRLSEAITEYLWRRSLLALTHHISFDLRNNFYRHLMKLSFSWFNKAHTGDIMSRATNDIQQVRAALQFGLSFLVRNVILLIGGLVIMFSVNFQLALFTLAPLIAMTFIMKFILPKIYKLSMKVQEQMATLSTHAQENFSGIRVIKAYATEEIEKRKFNELSEEYVNRNMEMVYLRAYMAPLFLTVMMICPLLILWLGGQYIIKEEFTIGMLVMFLSYQRMMLWPMMMFGMVMARLQRGGAAMARINRIMSIHPEIQDDLRTGPDMEIKGDIEFRNLAFQYEDSGFSLENINLHIPSGSTVGIVGPVGSGKSSFVSLIMRLFDLPDGKLYIDGRDINTIPLNRLRSSIGYVPQDSFLFSESVRGNISFGNPDIDFAQVVEAARIAQVADDIESFVNKYDQLIGERGVTLSGGQKQRIAIARAIVLNPSILILDDSLSSVDTHTEEAILQGLNRFNKNRTTLLISHRISTVATADFIIVLDKGRIIEKGTHTELIDIDGLYASIYRKQRLETQIESTGD